MINVKEKNVCQSQQWLKEFQEHALYRDLSKKYKFVISSYREMSLLRAALHHTVYETSRKFTEDYSVLDVTPYYYINFLLEKNPQIIVDLGCGTNPFKKNIPGIIGIDADKQSNFDVFDHFDQEFVKGHQQFCDALITINCIHFNSIKTIKSQLLQISSLLKPGGRAFVSTNLETWLMYTDRDVVVELFGQHPQFEDIVNYVNNQIQETQLNFIVNDWPVLHYNEHSTIRDDYNGNIRLVFEV